MVITQQPNAVVLQSGHYLHEQGSRSEYANYIEKKQFHDDLREAQMAYIDLTKLERVHTKASSKIKRFGRSVSQRRMPRETEKPPLTMIDEKPTDGTITSKNDQD